LAARLPGLSGARIAKDIEGTGTDEDEHLRRRRRDALTAVALTDPNLHAAVP